MQRNSLCRSLLAAGSLALLLGFTATKSAQAQDAVVPLDTFNFDISGYNSDFSTGYFLTPVETATFGATTVFTAAGPNGQNITITSAETIGATTTTDTFTVSTPTNFLTTATVNNTTITSLFFDLGLESGTDPVNVLLPISSYTATGKGIYNTNTNINLTPTTSLGTGSTSYSAYEGVNAGTSAINSFKVHSFTYSITYATLAAAPEPSQYAALAIGGLGLGMMALRARRRSVA